MRLQHKVPPQHMVETCAGSRGPTHRQKDIIEKFGPIKYGKYSPEEDDTIVKNWKSFCKVIASHTQDVQFQMIWHTAHEKNIFSSLNIKPAQSAFMIRFFFSRYTIGIRGMSSLSCTCDISTMDSLRNYPRDRNLCSI